MINDKGAVVVIAEGNDVDTQIEALGCCWAVFLFTF